MTISAPPARRLAFAAGLLVIALLSCGREITGPVATPVSAFRRTGSLAFSPQYETAVRGSALQAALLQVAFERVRITLRREDGTIALDTVVDFPAGADALTLSLIVPLPPSTSASGVPMSMNLGYVNATGDTVFKGGPLSITVLPSTGGGAPPPPVQLPVHYTGIGANATAVNILPKLLAGLAGQSAAFSAQALGSGGQVIAGTPVVFSSSDAGVVRIDNPSSGNAVLVGRGTARVYAQLLTGPIDSAVVTVTLPASTLSLTSGGDQAGPAGANLPQPIVARVTASDGIGVSGVTVNFAVASGGGTITPSSAVSAANGQVSASWKLGPTAGAQSLTLTASGLTGSPLTVNATAQAVIASKLVMTTAPVSGKAGSVLPPVAVTAQDALGNTVTTFTGNVSVAIGNNPGSATLGGTTTVAAVNGVATFSNLSLNRPGTAYTLIFSSSGLSSAASTSFDIATGDAARLVFGPMVSTADAGIGMGSVLVTAQDAVGNAVTSYTGAVTVAIGNNPGASTLSGTLTRPAVAGVATFNDLKLNKKGSSYTLTASATGLTSGTSAAFNVAAGPATGLIIVSGDGQTAAAGGVLKEIAVRLRDALDNSIEGASIAFAVTGGGGSLSAATAITDTAGMARVLWTIGGGPQTMTATFTGLPPITIKATGIGGGSSYAAVSSGDWSNPATWSPAGVPGALDEVTIGGERIITLTAPAAVRYLTFNTGAVIQQGNELQVTGNVAGAFGSISGGVTRVTGAGAHSFHVDYVQDLFIDNGAVVSMTGYVEASGDVTVSGTGALLKLNSNALYVSGNFATASGGAVDLTNSSDYLYVYGSAVFGGGSTAGKLTLGTLKVVGDFTQSGAANSFAPSVDFYTYLGAPAVGAALRSSPVREARSQRAAAPRSPAVEAARNARAPRLAQLRAERAERYSRLDRRAAAYARRGLVAPPRGQAAQPVNTVDGAVSRLRRPARFMSGTSVITFANPTSSFFGELYLGGPEYILASDVQVAGELETGYSSWHQLYSNSSTPRKLTSHGADVTDLGFNNVSWNLLDGGDVWAMDYVEFDNMDPAADQFTVARTSDERSLCDCNSYYQLYQWAFFTTPTTCRYIKATDTNGGPNLLELRLDFPFPSAHGGHVSTAGGALISNWMAAVTWTGITSNSWNVASNWSGGAVPISTDDVLIPTGIVNKPLLNTGPGYAHNLTVESGMFIQTSCSYELYVYGNVVAPLDAPAVQTCEGDAIHLFGDGTAGGNTVVGNFEMVKVAGNYKVSGPGNQVKIGLSWGGVYIDGTQGGNLTLNGGRVDAPGFETMNGGTLTMTNAADQLFVGNNNAYFNGGSTAGKLTAGTITITDVGCLYAGGTAPDAFAPSGTNTTVFAGTTNCVQFADPVSSFFHNVTVNAGTTLTVDTDNASSPLLGFNANGTLSRGAGAGTMTIVSGYAPSPRIANASGLNITGGATTFADFGLRLQVGTTNTTLNTVTFTGFAGYNGPILKVHRNSPEIVTFNALDFSAVTGLVTGGVFLENSNTATVNIRGSNPGTGSLGPHYAITSTGTVSWIP